MVVNHADLQLVMELRHHNFGSTSASTEAVPVKPFTSGRNGLAVSLSDGCTASRTLCSEAFALDWGDSARDVDGVGPRG